MNHDLDSDEDKTYMAPHILAISATPIPRTLALALYGDMSLTQVSLPLYSLFYKSFMPLVNILLRISFC